jgi:hypothetical protein
VARWSRLVARQRATDRVAWPRRVIFILGAVTAFAPVAIDLYLPAEMGQSPGGRRRIRG